MGTFNLEIGNFYYDRTIAPRCLRSLSMCMLFLLCGCCFFLSKIHSLQLKCPFDVVWNVWLVSHVLFIISSITSWSLALIPQILFIFCVNQSIKLLMLMLLLWVFAKLTAQQKRSKQKNNNTRTRTQVKRIQNADAKLNGSQRTK